MPSDGGSSNGIGGNEGSAAGSSGSGDLGGFGGYGMGNPGSYGGQDTVGAPGFADGYGGQNTSGSGNADNDAQNAYGYDVGYANDQQAAENSGSQNANDSGQMGFFDRALQNPLFKNRGILYADDPARAASQFAALKGEIGQEQADAYDASPKADVANALNSIPGRAARSAFSFANPVAGIFGNVATAAVDPNPDQAVSNVAQGLIGGALIGGVVGSTNLGPLGKTGASMLGKGVLGNLGKGPSSPDGGNGLTGMDGGSEQPALDMAQGRAPAAPQASLSPAQQAAGANTPFSGQGYGSANPGSFFG